VCTKVLPDLFISPTFGNIECQPPWQGQNDCYVQLDEASGFDVSPYQADLNAKACELKAAFPDTSLFKPASRYSVSGFM
jgi:hypothetical protein